MSITQGVLFLRNENEKLKWFEDGDEDKDIKYKGKIISDVLDMSVEEALVFFENIHQIIFLLFLILYRLKL